MPSSRPEQDTRAKIVEADAAPTPDDAPAQPTSGQGKPLWAMTRREAERHLRTEAGLPRLRRRWPWVLLVLVLILAAAGAGAAWWRMQQMAINPEVVAEAEPEPEDPLLQLIPAEYLTVQPRTLDRMTRVSGTLRPVRQAQLASQTSGPVQEVEVEPGDTVAAGDLLVQVDAQPLRIELDLQRSTARATETQLGLARAQLERAEELSSRGVATSSTLDEARSNVDAQTANLDALQDQVRAAELRLENASLRAPFDGVVSVREVDPGQYVQVGTPLLTVVDLSSVELEANAPISAGAGLARGQTVEVTVDGLEGHVFEGVVERINPVASEGSRTIPVYIAIENPDGAMRGGMFASGRVIVEQVEGALAVPASALREDAEGTHVLRVVDGRLERAAVETGGTWAGSLVRVSEGLEPGDVVVSAPLTELAAGDAVELLRPVTAGPNAEAED